MYGKEGTSFTVELALQVCLPITRLLIRLLQNRFTIFHTHKRIKTSFFFLHTIFLYFQIYIYLQKLNYPNILYIFLNMNSIIPMF